MMLRMRVYIAIILVLLAVAGCTNPTAPVPEPLPPTGANCPDIPTPDCIETPPESKK